MHYINEIDNINGEKFTYNNEKYLIHAFSQTF